eukprot:3424919-Amphidinium_carterae.1
MSALQGAEAFWDDAWTAKTAAPQRIDVFWENAWNDREKKNATWPERRSETNWDFFAGWGL